MGPCIDSAFNVDWLNKNKNQELIYYATTYLSVYKYVFYNIETLMVSIEFSIQYTVYLSLDI